MNDYELIFSILPIFISIQAVRQLKTNWPQFWDSKITLVDRDLATRIAVFILVPLGILLHEVGHSLATWQVGGKVETFRWFFFSGYIIPVGDFSYGEDWWISFAGNLVSISLAIFSIPLIFYSSRRIIGEVFYRFVAIQSVYSLVYYPLYSAFTGDGDWAYIYRFDLNPLISWLLMLHLGLLWGLWQLYHSQKMLQWRLSRHAQGLAIYKQLTLDLGNRPNDLQPKLDLVYFLLEKNETYEAKKIASRIICSYPQEISTKVLGVVISFYKYKYSSRKTITSAQKLLSYDLSQKDQVIIYRVLSSALCLKKKPIKGLKYADLGLVIAPNNYMLLYHRARIYEQLNKRELAIADLELALSHTSDPDLREAFSRLKHRKAKS